MLQLMHAACIPPLLASHGCPSMLFATAGCAGAPSFHQHHQPHTHTHTATPPPHPTPPPTPRSPCLNYSGGAGCTFVWLCWRGGARHSRRRWQLEEGPAWRQQRWHRRRQRLGSGRADRALGVCSAVGRQQPWQQLRQGCTSGWRHRAPRSCSAVGGRWQPACAGPASAARARWN